jgi:Pyridine nucleotide-disulphide oxidoreductase
MAAFARAAILWPAIPTSRRRLHKVYPSRYSGGILLFPYLFKAQMPSQMTPSALEDIIRTSRIPNRENVYTIGPFGYRVGFAFQQQRALNLVLALKEIFGKEQLMGKKIVVVGGGVAGVTAFTALAKFGCKSVKIYEQASDVLELQKHSTHRLVHPNYNKWPVVENLNVFTDFPILNWHAGPADKVVTTIQEQFNKVVADAKLKLPAICGTTFEKIVKNDRGGTTVQFKNKAGESEEISCDILIFASGFGTERKTGGLFKTYWEPPPPLPDGDTIEKPINIFGTGDGALIDLVRCYAKKGDEFWKIPLGLISFFRNDRHFSILSGSATNNSGSDSDWTLLEDEIRHHELTTAPLVWQLAVKPNSTSALSSKLCTREKEFYCGLMKRVCEELTIENFLESQLKAKPADDLTPTLVGLRETPFEPTSAPINKMLLAYLLNTDRVKYSHVSKDDSDKDTEKIRNMAADEAARRIDIVRMGADAPLVRAFELAAEDVSVLTILSGSSPPEPAHDDGLLDHATKARAGDDLERYKVTAAPDRAPIISSFFESYFDAEPNCATFKPMGQRGDGRFLVAKPPNLHDDKINSTLRDLGGLERKVFGFPIAWHQKRITRQEF